MKDANLDESNSTTEDNRSSETAESHEAKKVGIVQEETPGNIAGETLEQVGETTAEPSVRTDVSTGRSAFFVGAGILISRIVGLVRQRIFAHYFGSSAEGDAFSAAFRIPNFLQNVFGEGALSASFIPVYAKLLAQGDEKEATRVANAIFSILALVTAVIVLIGVLTTPYIVTLIAAGFEEERRELTITLVRIFFPGAALLVLSAWCLGVLNSHHRFFISYTAPVAWNAAIIATLLFFGNRVDLASLAAATAWGSVIGSALQFGVQLPAVLRLVHRFRPELTLANSHVRQVLKSFFPVFVSRGVVQISAFVDAFLASFLGQGAVVALNYAQSLYTLPVSLFGMSVSAAELPAMSKTLGAAGIVAETLRHRLDQGLQRISFFIVPSAVAFLTLGDVIAAVLYQTGKFTRDDTIYVWTILAGASVGLLASTLGRLYSSTYYALRDTRTPLLFAALRVGLGSVLGYFFSIHLPGFLGLDSKLGAAGLTVASGLAGWVEFVLLRNSLNKRIGRTGLSLSYSAKLWLGALLGAGVGWALKMLVAGWHPIPLAMLVLGSYGTCYFAVGYLFGVLQARTIIRRLLSFVGI